MIFRRKSIYHFLRGDCVGKSNYLSEIKQNILASENGIAFVVTDLCLKHCLMNMNNNKALHKGQIDV